MAIKTIEELKAYFETGDKPTEAEFVHLIDTLIAAAGLDGQVQISTSGRLQASDLYVKDGLMGLNKADPVYALDTAAPAPVITTLSGTSDYSGSIMTGTNTAYTTELQIGDVVTFGTHGTATIATILSDTLAYVNTQISQTLNNITVTKSQAAGQLLNLFDYLKIERNGNGLDELTASINDMTVGDGNLFLKLDGVLGLTIELHTNGHVYRITSVVVGGVNALEIKHLGGNVAILQLFANGSIAMPNLPTSSSGTGLLYRSGNDLKIG